MDILIIILAVCALACVRIRKKDEGGELSAAAQLPVRGVIAIIVILHHVAQEIAAPQSIFYYFVYIGYLAVAVFLAVSGYALLAQYNKNPSYLKGFFRKRFSSLLVPYIIATLIMLAFYTISDLIGGKSIPELWAWLFSGMFINGSPILPYSWYVETIAALYIVFYLAFRFVKNKKVKLVLLFAGIFAIVGLLLLLGYGEWWYKSIFAFGIGALYFEFSKSKLYDSIPRWAGILGSMLLFLLSKVLLGGIADAIVSSSLFGILVFQLLRAVKLKGKLLEYLGSRSYEIYLSQGIVIKTVWLFNIKNNILFFLLTLGGCIILGEALHRLSKYIVGSINKSPQKMQKEK